MVSPSNATAEGPDAYATSFMVEALPIGGHDGRVARYVALLRAVNLGSTNKVSMAELRALLESLGLSDVRTLLTSGNAAFTSPRKVTPARLESAICDRFGIDTAVMVRTTAELRRIVENNPFTAADPARVHVGFMERKPPSVTLDLERFLPEECVVAGREVYFHLPNGMGNTKLHAYVNKQLKVPMTVRTLGTVTKLASA